MANMSMSIHFFINSYLGFILAALLLLGLALTPAIRLRPVMDDDDFRLAPVWAVLTGALFFGVGHIFVAIVNGLPILDKTTGNVPFTSFLTLAFGFMAGFGLSIALHDQLAKHWRIGFGRIVLRLGLVLAVFAAIQVVFERVQSDGASLSIVWPSPTFRAFAVYMFGDNYETLQEWAAIVDSAAVGIVVTIGVAIGLALAQRFITRWNA
jgi:hypothetical protein